MDSSFSNPGAGNNSINVKNELPVQHPVYDCVLHSKMETRQKTQVGLCIFNALFAAINCIMLAALLTNQVANRNHLHDISAITREHVLGAQNRVMHMEEKIIARMEQLTR